MSAQHVSRTASRPRGLVVAALAALALAGCGGGTQDAFEEQETAAGTSPAATGGGGGQLTVGGAAFTEMQVMQQMYAQLLEDAGFTVDLQVADNRELYAPALESGAIDVVPDYAATMAEYLNVQENGPDATSTAPIATNDAQETVEAMRPLAEERGLTVLEPSQALSANGFVVTRELADAEGLSTLTDLGELGRPLVLAAGEECPDRPFCEPGLERVYGLDITEITPLGFGTVATKEAVRNGDADLGLVGTTDGTLDAFELVLLEDDKKLQLADNLVPIVNTESAGSPEVAEVLDGLSEVLTTEDLTGLNAQVDAERQKPEDVARAYLEEKGLLG